MKANMHLVNLVQELKKASIAEKVNLWKRIATDLEKPTRQRRIVNLGKLEKHVRHGETAIVPGKVLGGGELSKKLDVAAFSFSKTAKEKINDAKGKTMSIHDLMKSNPKAKKVRIIG